MRLYCNGMLLALQYVLFFMSSMWFEYIKRVKKYFFCSNGCHSQYLIWKGKISEHKSFTCCNFHGRTDFLLMSHIQISLRKSIKIVCAYVGVKFEPKALPSFFVVVAEVRQVQKYKSVSVIEHKSGETEGWKNTVDMSRRWKSYTDWMISNMEHFLWNQVGNVKLASVSADLND